MDYSTIPMEKFNSTIQKAKNISSEFTTLATQPKIDSKKIFNLMIKMNESMLEMMGQLKTAFDSNIHTFTEQLKASTSFSSNELNYIKKEIDEVKSNDELECLNTLQACSRDLKKVWIRFAYVKDAEEVRRANSYAAINDIFAQLNIKLKMSQFPIESFYFKTKKFTQDQLVPEIALCCTFVSSALATFVKNGIRNFNKALDDSNKSHLVRYGVSADWSFNIRNILKPCNEMKRFEIIERVYVTNDGLKVYHKNIGHEQHERKFTFVNSIKKLDILRRKLNDFNSTVSATETYNNEYFSLSVDERKAVRKNYFENIGNDTIEYQIDDDEAENM